MPLAVDWSPLVQAAVGAAGVGVTAVTGAMMAAAPQAFRAIGAVLHGKRRMLVALAVRTAAQNAVSSFQKGTVTMDAAVAAMLAYVRLNVGDTLQAMRVGDATLQEMCSAEFAAVLTERQAACPPACQTACQTALAPCPPPLPEAAA